MKLGIIEKEETNNRMAKEAKETCSLFLALPVAATINTSCIGICNIDTLRNNIALCKRVGARGVE